MSYHENSQTPEPNFSLSGDEVDQHSANLLQKVEDTLLLLPGFLGAREKMVAGKSQIPPFGFLNLRCKTIDERQASIAYLQTDLVKQWEVRVFQERRDSRGIVEPHATLERESVFVSCHIPGDDEAHFDPEARIVYERSIIGNSRVTLLDIYQDSHTAVSQAEDLLKRIANPRPLFDVADETANFRFDVREALDHISDRHSLGPVESAEELLAKLPPLSVDQEYVTLGEEEIKGILEDHANEQRQERIMIDWNQDFIRRWKPLFDGLSLRD